MQKMKTFSPDFWQKPQTLNTLISTI